MTCRRLVVEPGAVLAGPGLLTVEGCTFADYLATGTKGLVLADGASVVYSAPNSSINDGLAVPAVVGEPAFWVDVSQASSMTYAEDDAGMSRVSRLNDVRGEGYPFATSAGTLSPELVTNENGQTQHIYFEKVPDVTSAKNCHTLVWNSTIRGICSVFKVMCAREGGGQILGGEPFRRGQDYAFNQDFFSGTVGTRHPELDEGRFFVNGRARTHKQGYAYPGGDVTTPAARLVPMVVEVHATKKVENCMSNGFESEFDNKTGMNGDQRLYECLVYTNMLTDAEILQIRAYLMKKWLNLECDAARVSDPAILAESVNAADGVQAVLAEGTSVLIGSLTGAGTVAKSGAGTLYIDDLNDATTSLAVEDGAVTLRSVEASGDDLLPEGAALHVDISRTDTFKTLAHGSRTRVYDWCDCRGDGYPVLRPHVTTDRSRWPGYDKVTTYEPIVVNGWKLAHFGESTGKTTDANVTSLDFEDASGNKMMIGGVQSIFGLYHMVKSGPIRPIGCVSGKHLLEDGEHYGLRSDGKVIAGGSSTGDCDLPSTRGKVYGGGGDYVTGGTYVRIDGAEVNPYGQGYNSGASVLSFVSCEKFATDAIGPVLPVGSETFNEGGFAVGEVILYQRALSPESAKKVEAYLLKKWYNQKTPGYRGAVMDKLTVAAGATVNVSGHAPIVANGVSGAGTVNGTVQLAAGAVFEVPVAANGTLAAVSVTGTIDLTRGGTVRILGGTVKPVAGRYVLVPASKLAAPFDLAGWTVELVGVKGRRTVSLAIDGNGSLVADVSAPGLTVIVR